MQAVAEAGVKLEQITSVELVGGSSRVPLVTSKLLEAFQRDPSRTLNAKESVSRGAALQCAMLSPIFRWALPGHWHLPSCSPQRLAQLVQLKGNFATARPCLGPGQRRSARTHC